jgi:SAM-dependent methyltransferase
VRPEEELRSACRLRSARAAAERYDAWAGTYDKGFARAMGYVAPRRIAEVFAARAGAEDAPVLDVGAGTGLVAEALPGREIDGIDISEGMLARAGEKGLYGRRIVADLTQPLALGDAGYGGIVSAGTFSHGHVGAEALPELLRVARPGALFALGTIPAVFDEARIGSALALMVAGGAITPVGFVEIAIYEGAEHPHMHDRGLVMVFRKRGSEAP